MSELPSLCLFSQLSSLGLCMPHFSYLGIWPWRLFLSGHQLPPYGPQLVDRRRPALERPFTSVRSTYFVVQR